MSKSKLSANKRDESINPRQLRSSGKVPATLYGKGVDSVSLELNTKEFMINYKKDKNAIFELNFDSENSQAIVKKVQIKSSTDQVLNVEFQKIRSDAKIKIAVALEFVGESPAVKSGAELNSTYTEMEIECLPADIPSFITIDLSCLEKYEDSIAVKDIKYPKGVVSLVDAETVIAKASAPKAAEVEVEAEAEGEAEAVQEEAAQV